MQEQISKTKLAQRDLVSRAFQVIQRDYPNSLIGPDSWSHIWHEVCDPDREDEYDQLAVIVELCEQFDCDISADYED